jgi:hypothetical protein
MPWVSLVDKVTYCSKFRESVMSLDHLSEIEYNLEKNQKARNELFNLVAKAYYVDPIKYKIDDTTSDLEYSN